MPDAPPPAPTAGEAGHAGHRGGVRRPTKWRLGSAVVLLIAAVLAITSQASSDGADLRPGRYTDLASLVKNESTRVERQQQRVRELEAEVERLTADVSDPAVEKAEGLARAAGEPAGMRPVTGPGVTVVLSDAPPDVINSSSIDINRYVVHQQDIQAVVNAMWNGGARAVTVQGKRIVSTTGIKCEGNSVTLEGVPYPQPYTISAVGDQAELLAALETDPAVTYFRADAADPSIGVGWALSTQISFTAPAYDGPLGMSYARVAR